MGIIGKNGMGMIGFSRPTQCGFSDIECDTYGKTIMFTVYRN
jgi:hypothetical protein